MIELSDGGGGGGGGGKRRGFSERGGGGGLEGEKLFLILFLMRHRIYACNQSLSLIDCFHILGIGIKLACNPGLCGQSFQMQIT